MVKRYSGVGGGKRCIETVSREMECVEKVLRGEGVY